MGPPSYMRSVVDRNVVIRRVPVFDLQESPVSIVNRPAGETGVRHTAKTTTFTFFTVST